MRSTKNLSKCRVGVGWDLLGWMCWLPGQVPKRQDIPPRHRHSCCPRSACRRAGADGGARSSRRARGHRTDCNRILSGQRAELHTPFLEPRRGSYERLFAAQTSPKKSAPAPAVQVRYSGNRHAQEGPRALLQTVSSFAFMNHKEVEQ